ncbi:MAG: cbb3-type cytochrome c oxidase subunit I [Armatimonadetes bacterium]|nr:cbb3-type cytochrome c oxidase subunit I [Armatimonadota bacterium]
MSAQTRRGMVLSPLWLQVSILTFVAGFAVLGILAYLIYRDEPPIPARVVDPAGAVLFTGEDILAGKAVFQKYGLMEYGTLFGHGAYLGPDFTADYLHRQALRMRDFYAAAPGATGSAAERVVTELKQNRYDPESGTLTFSEGQARAFLDLVPVYAAALRHPQAVGPVPAVYIRAAEELRQLATFFAWGAWACAATRPGATYSYTNNWPPEPLAGNFPTADALLWSALSIAALLGGTGLVLFFFGRYDWLGWQAEGGPELRFRRPEDVPLTPGQRATRWYFLVVGVLFLLQTLVGGLNAHYRAEPSGFFGLDLTPFIPYMLSRTWHLQLAIFFVAAAYLAAGIFVTPLIAGREPRGQAGLSYALLGAVAVVVFGSLLGEAAGMRGSLGGDLWYWLGAQGWEYLDLGRLWQILLIIGLFFWVGIIYRGLRHRLRGEHRGNMPYLFLYASLAIPAFYAVGLLATRHSSFVVTDFWRFWVVHLWVEDFLELFTTATVAYIFVLLGVVSERTGTRVIYLSIILYSIGGVIGTMHHLYFSGAPSTHLALGAFFSAMEVIPLTLLTLEAYSFLRLGALEVPGRAFPHRWAAWSLVAVGFWNFLGAGIFGFIINLPIVSYYEIGTALTANHGHTAMFGVYGMLAVGLTLFCLRYLVPPEGWNDRLAGISVWSLNIGLAWMAFVNLFPIGVMQLYDSYNTGYWHAREMAFLMRPLVNRLEWARLPGDALFIVGGVLPLLILAIRGAFQARPASPEAENVVLFEEAASR